MKRIIAVSAASIALMFVAAQSVSARQPSQPSEPAPQSPQL